MTQKEQDWENYEGLCEIEKKPKKRQPYRRGRARIVKKEVRKLQDKRK